jgi:hypothetical protein
MVDAISNGVARRQWTVRVYATGGGRVAKYMGSLSRWWLGGVANKMELRAAGFARDLLSNGTSAILGQRRRRWEAGGDMVAIATSKLAFPSVQICRVFPDRRSASEDEVVGTA